MSSFTDTACRPLTLALVGQPNAGKSTLFNAIAGYKTDTGNFPGTSLCCIQSDVVVAGRRVRVLDLPGTYAISPRDATERITRDSLSFGRADGLIVVLDASVLSRSLELALQLLELDIPMVVALNMVDEAQRKGIEVDIPALEARLGVPVIPTVATRGIGLVTLLTAAIHRADHREFGTIPVYDRGLEEAVAEAVQRMPEGLAARVGAPRRFVALQLIEGDPVLEPLAAAEAPGYLDEVRAIRHRLAAARHLTDSTVVSTCRHAAVMDLFEAVAQVVPRRRRSLSDRVDKIVMHPWFGLMLAVGAFLGMFAASYQLGGLLEAWISWPFDALGEVIRPASGEPVWWILVRGGLQGLAAGAAVVLPYLLPLVFLMALLEDVGYLPRAAFLADGLLHRVGLHGKSIVPLILGYGCSVPAILGTRILENRRDRLVTAVLIPMLPCSARTVIILALAGAMFGTWAALGLFVLNIVVTALVGRLLSACTREPVAGLLMDIPPYRIPPVGLALKKMWFRSREFFVSAWPILILASMGLAALDAVGAGPVIDRALRPITVGVLGLPEGTGMPLFFGLLRKELSLVMLFQAMGTRDLAAVMTPVQVLTFVVFVTFYIPCVAAIVSLVREVGWRWAGVSVAMNTVVAFLLAIAVRLIF